MPTEKISPELQAKAIAELNEVPSKKREYIELIKNWLKEQEHIKARTDDQWLLVFLRGCRYDVKEIKTRIDRLYTMKTVTPKMYHGRDPFKPELQEIMQEGTCLPLPALKGSTDPHMWIVRASKIVPQRMADLLKYMLMLAEICIREEPNFAICGGTCIVDLADMDDRIFTDNINFWKKLLYYIVKCYPIRHKGMYYINAPPSFQQTFQVLGQLPFFCDKINKEMTAFFSENEFHKLLERINVLNFPQDYEGNNKSIKELTAYWKEKVESYKDWFIEDECYGTKENKRVGKPITEEDFYKALQM